MKICGSCEEMEGSYAEMELKTDKERQRLRSVFFLVLFCIVKCVKLTEGSPI